MSLSCAISFAIKMTEPYMQKYIKIVINFLFRKPVDNVEENTNEDYVNLYNKNNDTLLEGTDMQELDNKDRENPEQTQTPLTKLIKKDSTMELNNMADTLNVFTKEMEASDFFIRMIGITVSTEEDKQYDFDPGFANKIKGFLPWEDNLYNSKGKFNEYTNKTLPEWLTKDLSNYSLNF